MARNSDDRAKILQILAENPSVSYACKKVGIARATHYRWMKDNASYRVSIERALSEGRTQWNEVAEAALMKKVHEGNLRAIEFYLTHNDPRYIPKRSIFVEPMSEKERRNYERMLLTEQKLIPQDILNKIIERLQNYGIVQIEKSKN